MKRSKLRPAALAFTTILSLGACSGATGGELPRTVQPGAPGEPTVERSPERIDSATRPGYTPADVAFMQDMLHHHAQAIVMTDMVPDRTDNEQIRLIARRIELSQDDEMAMIRRWLERRGEEVPDIGGTGHHHHAGHAADMPGMLTDEQLARLEAASGAEFDRLFLEYMIQHHEGALVMVEELFATDGAGQEGELFQFASHVDSDQRVEIERMSQLLLSLP